MPRTVAISEFSIVPRGHPHRLAAARRIRALRFEDNWQRNWRRIRASSVWTKRWGLGCVQTGELFGNAHEAGARYRIPHRSLLRSAADGRPCGRGGLQFVWLNGLRWREKTVWDSRTAIGCVQTGDLFLKSSLAATWAGASHSMIWWSAARGTVVHGRFTFVFLWPAMRARYERKRELWRKKESHENRNRSDDCGRKASAA